MKLSDEWYGFIQAVIAAILLFIMFVLVSKLGDDEVADNPTLDCHGRDRKECNEFAENRLNEQTPDVLLLGRKWVCDYREPKSPPECELRVK